MEESVSAALRETTDLAADAWEEGERRLEDWGRSCRQNSEALGMPTLSSIAAMIEHVKRQERLQKGARKKKLRERRRNRKPGDPPIDPKEIAEEYGFIDAELTAKGKQIQTFRPTSMRLDSKVAQTDYVVSRLPKWAKKIIYRSFLYGQPNRFAADDMMMREDEYESRRRCAVEQVAERLGLSYSLVRDRPGGIARNAPP